MPRAISGGVGLPGTETDLGLLRQGWELLAADPKPVTERTTDRVFGVRDVGKPKALALQDLAADLGLAERLDARCGRVEHVVGGQEWRAAELVVLATDRPATTRRVTEICLRLADASQPLRLITCHVSDGAAQVRSFAFPAAGGPCPLCGSGDAFITSILSEDGNTCERERPGGDGDRFTMPYGAVEGLAAAALALRAVADPNLDGTDTTLALGPDCAAFASRLSRDPGCLARCAATAPWPAMGASLGPDSMDTPLLGGLTAAAEAAGLDPRRTTLQFLRALALGAECGCGRDDAPRVFRNPCHRCGSPVAALRGYTSELPLAELPPGATAETMALPPYDLVLLKDPLSSQVPLTVAVGGVLHDD